MINNYTHVNYIVAMTARGVIGKNGTLPWRLPADLAHFRKITLGHTVVMGRKTYESIGHALPGRRNIVLTHDPYFTAPGCEIVYSIPELEDACQREVSIFVIGGASIYRELRNLVDSAYVTIIDADLDGDTFYPELGREIVNETLLGIHPADDRNSLSMRFIRYDFAPLVPA